MKTIKTPLWYLMSLAALSVILSSCKDPMGDVDVTPIFNGGVYVMCEGNYGDGNASISFYNNGEATNNIFQTINGRPLGDQGQSITIYNGKAYLLVQNSGKIEVVHSTTFESIAKIDDRIFSPRYMVVYNGTGYVSDWVSNYIKIINLNTNAVTDSIAVDAIPDKLLIKGATLYVSNAGFYPNPGDKISIIDLTTNTKTGSITTASNPGGLVEDADGKIWVLCGGDGYATPSPINAAMVKIDPSTNTVLTTINFSAPGDYPYHLEKGSASNVLYYTLGGKLYKFPTSNTAEPAAPFLTRNFYSFGINPNNDDVIGTIVPSFSSAGKVVRYNSAGVKQDSATVGIAPGDIAFQ